MYVGEDSVMMVKGMVCMCRMGTQWQLRGRFVKLSCIFSFDVHSRLKLFVAFSFGFGLGWPLPNVYFFYFLWLPPVFV